MAGTYQLLKNEKARLQYMYKGERYSTTVNAKNDTEASVALANYVTTIRNGEDVKSNCTYLELAQKWMNEYVRTTCSDTVQQNYKRNLNNNILPYLGRYKLEDITPNVLRNFFNDMKTWETKYKPPRKNEPISRETFKKLYNIVSGTFQRAYEWEIIRENPCRRVPLKSLKLERLPSEINKIKNNGHQRIRAYNKETYKKVLDLLDNKNNKDDKDRVKKVCVEFALKTGLCLEELAGLEWKRDYNKDLSTITVNVVQVYIKGTGWISKEPKELKRHRTIELSKTTNNLLINLRKEYPKNKYIFFELINFNCFTRWLKNWQTQNDIYPVLTTHELRHTHATLLLQEGVPVKYISERLGHSTTDQTENTYIEYLAEHNSSVATMIDKI